MNRRKILLLLAAMIAALGTLLVFLYVQGAEGRAKEKVESVDVLVATQNIEQGEAFDEAAVSKFELREVPKDTLLAGAQTNLEDLKGLVALQPIYAGEQVISAKWGGSVDITSSVLAIPDDKVAASVNLSDPARVAGFVNPGSEVAILISVEGDAPAYTRTLLERVTVLGVGSTSTVTSTKKSDDGESTTAEIPQTLMTLAVTQKEAEKLLWGSTFAGLSFALVTEESKLSKTEPVNEPNLFK